MSDPASSAPKVLVLHGYVDRMTPSGGVLVLDMLLARYGQNASIFSKRVNFFSQHFTLSTDHHDTDFTARRA